MPPDSATSGRSPSSVSPIVTKRFDALTAGELHEILRLRSQVFVVEQNCVYNDIDGFDDDPGTTHHWLVVDGTLAAYVRVVRTRQASRLGRVVTHPDHRTRGLAARLVAHIRDTVSGSLTLEAQTQLVPWYQDLGFEVVGSEYTEDGIAHVPMARRSS